MANLAQSQTYKMEVIVPATANNNETGLRVENKKTDGFFNTSLRVINRSASYGYATRSSHAGDGIGIYGNSASGDAIMGVTGIADVNVVHTGGGASPLASGVFGYSSTNQIGVEGYSDAGIGGYFSSNSGIVGLVTMKNLGIKTETAFHPVTFKTEFGDKISFYGGESSSLDNHFGVGVQTSQLQFYAPTTADNISFGVGRSSSFSEKMRITGIGNVGIGNTAPHAPLQFSNAAVNRKIVLYETANNDHEFYGLGINGFTLRYQVDATSANHIFYAATSASASNELMRIAGNGSVGINNSSPIHKIDVVGVGFTNGGTAGFKGSQYYSHFSYSTAEHTYIRGGKDAANVYINDIATLGNVGIGVGAPTEKLHVFGNLRVAGNICYSGTIGACSDLRYKKNFSKIENPLNKVLSLNGLHYDWRVDEFKENNFTKDRQIGFIAQEIEKIFPEMVFTDEKGYKSVDYSRLTPVLVEAIKEQQKMINELKTNNQKLESNNQKLESRLDNLEAILNK